MVAKKKHPKKVEPDYNELDRVKAAALNYKAPAGWHRIGVVLNAAGETCVWIAKGKGKNRQWKEIPV